VAFWSLFVSDRLLLQTWVPAAELGRYSLAYAIGNLEAIVVTSLVNNAASPLIFAALARGSGEAPRIGTTVIAAVMAPAIGLALLAQELLELLLPPGYWGAARYIPWIAFSYVWYAVYILVGHGAAYSKRNACLPLFTVVAAVTNIGLNLWLIPSGGALAAAANTVIGFAVWALLTGWWSDRVYPLGWHYGKWLRAVAAGLAIVAAGALVPTAWPLAARVAAKLGLSGLYPFALLALGIATGDDFRRARAWLAARLSIGRASGEPPGV
jgi:O-antigen/teichoic acid export membrane protein